MAFNLSNTRTWTVPYNGQTCEVYKVVDSLGNIIWRKYYNVAYDSNTTTNFYTVFIDSNGGDGNIDSLIVNVGDSATVPNCTFTRVGYYLDAPQYNTLPDGSGTSYSNGSTITPTSNLTLYAQWLANGYTVSFNAGSGSGSMPSFSALYNSTVSLPACTFTKVGHNFALWTSIVGSTEVEYSDQSRITMPNQSIQLTAQWEPAQYTVSFNANGGTALTDQIDVTYGEQYGNLPTPTYAGYNFAGWYTSSSGGMLVQSTTPVTATSDHILWAHWELPTITNVNAVLATDAKSQTLDYQNKSYGYMYHPNNSETDLPVWQTNVNYVFDDESFLSRSLTSNSGTAQGTTTKTFTNGGWSGIALKSLTPMSDVLYTKVKVSPFCAVKVQDDGGGIVNQWFWTDVSPQSYAMPPDGTSGQVAVGTHTYSRGKYFKVVMTIVDSDGSHTLTQTATSSSIVSGWHSGTLSNELLTFDFTTAIVNAQLKVGAKTTKIEFYESSSNSDWKPMILNACCIYKDTLN